jgi:hypothetical protein
MTMRSGMCRSSGSRTCGRRSSPRFRGRRTISGLVLAAEAFRQADWQVTLLLDCATGLILDRVRRLRPEAVGLSVSNLDRTHQVEHLIGDLQALPVRFRILLGGTAAERSAERCQGPRASRSSTISSPRSTRSEARSAGDRSMQILPKAVPASSVRKASGASAKPWRAPITGWSAWAARRGSAPRRRLRADGDGPQRQLPGQDRGQEKLGRIAGDIADQDDLAAGARGRMECGASRRRPVPAPGRRRRPPVSRARLGRPVGRGGAVDDVIGAQRASLFGALRPKRW